MVDYQLTSLDCLKMSRVSYSCVLGILLLTAVCAKAAGPGKCDQTGVTIREAKFSLSAQDVLAAPGTELKSLDMGWNNFCESNTARAEEYIPIWERYAPGLTPDVEGFVPVIPGLAVRFTLVRRMFLDSRSETGLPANFGHDNWPMVRKQDHQVRTMYFKYSTVATLKRVAGDLTQGQYTLPVGDMFASSNSGRRTDTLALSVMVPGPACKVSLPNQTVRLLDAKTSVLNGLNIGQAAAAGTSFRIKFDCVHTAKKMELTLFDANAGAQAPYFVLSGSTANGVALQLESVDGGGVILPGVPLTLPGPAGVGEYSPEFIAKYVKTDSVVTPGLVKARAVFTVTYD